MILSAQLRPIWGVPTADYLLVAGPAYTLEAGLPQIPGICHRTENEKNAARPNNGSGPNLRPWLFARFHADEGSAHREIIC